MAKRFRDSELRNKDWYREMGPVGRDLWNYLHDACDASGILEVDFKRLEFDLGTKFTKEKINEVLNNKGVWLCSRRLFLPAFIEFQYGELNAACKPHLAIIRMLTRRGVDPKTLTHLKGYPKGIHTLEEKEKDKEQEKEKEKEEGGVGETIGAGIPADVKREWESTLAHYGRQPNWMDDEVTLFQVFQRNGHGRWDRVKRALAGFRREEPGRGYDPSKFVNLGRLLKQEKFLHLEALGTTQKSESLAAAEDKIRREAMQDMEGGRCA